MINIELLKKFQQDAYKSYNRLGFSVDNTVTIFGIIIEQKNLIEAAEKRDIILLHKHMGICTWYLANWCSTNAINMSSCIDFSYAEKERQISMFPLEYYLQKIKEDLSFTKEINQTEKKEFVQRVWISIFPEDYHDDNFIEIEHILEENTNDNKIKFPEKFVEKESSKYGQE